MPLAVTITSGEQEVALLRFSSTERVSASSRFHKCGVEQGPPLAMTDDSSSKRNALCSIWSVNKYLYVHSTSFNGSGHGCMLERRESQIKTVLYSSTKQNIIYVESEPQLLSFYSEIWQSDVMKYYPNNLAYIEAQWDQRREWALCYHKHLHILVRTNQTNNYIEAGMRILKDLAFSRVKAYNLIQMFSFVTECLELQCIRKIVSAVHNYVILTPHIPQILDD